MKTTIISVAEYAESETIAAAVRMSDTIRKRTLARCYAIPGYAELPLQEKNAQYDKIKAEVIRECLH